MLSSSATKNESQVDASSRQSGTAFWLASVSSMTRNAVGSAAMDETTSVATGVQRSEDSVATLLT